jgi:hypothetical protein
MVARMGAIKIASCVAAAALLSACTTTAKGEALYFGIIRVDGPSGGVARTVRSRVLGGWVERDAQQEAIGLGYRDHSLLVLPPECRVVIIVRNDAELQSLRAAMGPVLNGEEKPCVYRE